MRLPSRRSLAEYLGSLRGLPVAVREVTPLHGVEALRATKGFTYGDRFLVEYEARGRTHRAVFEAVRPGPYGHEHMADRASAILRAHRAYNRLPRHARSLDVGAVVRGGTLESLGDVEEVFLVRDFVSGSPYFEDLERLSTRGEVKSGDIARADALCDYLVDVHSLKGEDPSLYTRRIRDLVGHGECIMGVIDRYPSAAVFLDQGILEEIERHAVAWRWRLRDRAHRLRQVHGDFHPWNILFRSGTRFTLLDRSRGEWGEPADDVVSLTMNYVLFALAGTGRFEGGLRSLFLRFWSRYLEAARDTEMLEVAPPFVAFRCLVLASPEWFPALGDAARTRLLRFALRVLEHGAFEPDQVGSGLA
jgi:aminoglycoside phosphotransferase (APT) family kinase protein